jgi:hypothetical protein
MPSGGMAKMQFLVWDHQTTNMAPLVFFNGGMSRYATKKTCTGYVANPTPLEKHILVA